jgi:hypothetical protein
MGQVSWDLEEESRAEIEKEGSTLKAQVWHDEALCWGWPGGWDR